jgi:hypothetical protein
VCHALLKKLLTTDSESSALVQRSPKGGIPSSKELSMPSTCCMENPSWALACELLADWVNQSLIASKAVKNDNAAVDFAIWSQPINLVLPCYVSKLQILQWFAIRRWRYNLVHWFCGYLQKCGSTLRRGIAFGASEGCE